MALDATWGGASADAYVSVADADAYFAARVGAEAWTDSTDTALKERALKTAARRLDQERWQGVPVSTTQALVMPRVYVRDDAMESLDVINDPFGDPLIAYVDMTTRPRRWLEANCELALTYLVGGTKDPWKDSVLSGFDSLGVGPISLEPSKTVRPVGALPNVVVRLIGAWRRSGNGTTRVERA